MTYEQARLFIDESNKKGIVLGLGNTREMLRRLGNPQDKLKFVHIAGTNGKGSALSYISAILEKSGYIVGRYVSPTIFSYRERIQVNEEMISKDDFAKYISIVWEVVRQMVQEGFLHPTAFEIETVAGFLYFYNKKCEIVILETGLGGDEDATNVINTAVCSVIMSISYDHTKILGDTIEQITTHKAGIIKKSVPVVLYRDGIKNNDAIIIENIIRKRCTQLGCELILAQADLIEPVTKDSLCDIESYREFDFRKELCFRQDGVNDKREKRKEYNENKFVQYFSYGHRKNLCIPLLGQFQLYNVAAAIEAVDVLRRQGYQISEDNLRKGLKKTVWHGRLEIISENPLIVIDGAHNPDAALKLRKSIEFYFTNKRKIYIMGVLSDKDYRKIIEFTVDLSDVIYTVTPNSDRALSANDLRCVIKDTFPKKKVIAAKSVENALNGALSMADGNSVIVCFGSLSYLGEISGLVKKTENYMAQKQIENKE